MRTRTRIMLAGLALGAVLAGGVAWATTTTEGTIHGCYVTKSGALRIVDGAEACKKNELAISWNKQGVKGDPGAAGAAGADGKDGRPGADGLAGVKGETGAAGADGKAGAKGERGEQGERGERGEPGTPGATGPQGPPGTPGGGAGSLTSLDGTPCGAAGGVQGVTKVTYATAMDSDAVSISCEHPVIRVTLEVGLSSRNDWWDCTPFLGATSYCSTQATGTVAVSPADMTGKSSCVLPDYDDTRSYNVGALCSFLFAPGTTVTLTASAGTSSIFLGWQAPYQSTPAHACVGTTTATCTITLNESRGVRAALDF